MINFSDIKEDIISVRFDTRQELEYLVDNLRKLGYVYGTGKMDNDVRNVLDDYGKLESSYLTLDRTRDYIESNWVSVEKHRNAISYDFKDIEWDKGLEKSDLIMENIRLDESDLQLINQSIDNTILKLLSLLAAETDKNIEDEYVAKIKQYEILKEKLKTILE